jgi:hypothetical protein
LRVHEEYLEYLIRDLLPVVKEEELKRVDIYVDEEHLA